jgi:ABC-type transport system involved in multi-copper enzyme maturation permease subunit
MRDKIRLTFRMHRFELIAIGIATVVLVLASYVVAARLDAVGFGPCAQAAGPIGLSSRQCEALAQVFYGIDQNEVTPVLGFIAILPYAAGLILGGPLIAREIERGTTRLAWSISPSRLRWYLARMLPVVAAILGLTFAAGFAADHLVAARTPGVDMSKAFDAFGTRGALVALTALVMTAGAIGLGAVIGRVLPTMILALILGSLGLSAVARVHAQYTEREAVIVEGENSGRGDRYVDQFFRLPDGRLVGYEELFQFDPEAMNSENGPQYPIVSLVIPGERYRAVEAREAIVLGGIAFAMLAGTALIVQRRRPG